MNKMNNNYDGFGVEFICTGNNGRSPMAETLAESYTEAEGYEGDIKVYSSGTKADEFTSEEHMIGEGRDSVIGAVKEALNSNMYEGRMEDIAEDVVEGEATNEEVIECAKYLGEKEASNRRQALLDMGFVPKDNSKTQTKPRDEVDLALTIGSKNYERANGIYKPTDTEVVTLDDFSGDYEDIEGSFPTMTQEQFAHNAEVIKEKAENSVDRVVEEYIES